MTPTILRVIADWFPEFSGPDWAAWRAFLAALFGLPMSEADLDLYRRCTGRQTPPAAPAREGWLIVGRRGGKSRVAALLAVYLAVFRRYRLAPGERGVVMLVAADRRQARVVLRYIRALLSVPGLETKVIRRTADALDLDNGISLEVVAASRVSVRGYTVVAFVADEIAYWPTEDAANPDAEILSAVRPAMATVPGAVLLALSSPYARRGELWRAYRQHHGQEDDPILVWQADTRTMHPALPQYVVDQAYEYDEVAARSEYGAEFRSDVETFVAREAIDAVIADDRLELAPVPGRTYFAFADPSGGASDSFALAIAHAEDGRAVLDLVREVRPPFSPEAVVADFAATLKLYGLSEVTADAYAAEWPRERWREAGIECRTSERSRSDLYRELLPALNSGRVELLDHPRLIAQLAALERRTARSGRDSIGHPPRGHDDVVNAAAGALVLALDSCSSASTVRICDWSGRMIEGTDEYGREWRDRKPYRGVFQGVDSFGRVTGPAARVEDGRLVEYLPDDYQSVDYLDAVRRLSQVRRT